jgi:hypothetical protein
MPKTEKPPSRPDTRAVEPWHGHECKSTLPDSLARPKYDVALVPSSKTAKVTCETCRQVWPHPYGLYLYAAYCHGFDQGKKLALLKVQELVVPKPALG